MSLSLATMVRRYVAEAKRAPAFAAGTALDELGQAASHAFEGAFVAEHSPVAPLTWMTRVTLFADQQESVSQPIALGEPVEIVGMMPTITPREPDPAVPAPLEAIDVFIEINRRDFLTAQTEKTTSPENDSLVVNLPHISVLAPRLFGLVLGSADPIMTVKFRWALTLAEVAAFGYSDTLISLGYFVRPLIPRREAST